MQDSQELKKEESNVLQVLSVGAATRFTLYFTLHSQEDHHCGIE